MGLIKLDWALGFFFFFTSAYLAFTSAYLVTQTSTSSKQHTTPLLQMKCEKKI